MIITIVFDYQDYSRVLNVYNSLKGDIILPILTLYKILFYLNYLYIVIVLIFKYFRDRSRLYSINRQMRPIMEVYRNSVYRNYT